MKPDEKLLLQAMQNNDGREYPRKITQRLGMNHKRADYIFSKWTDKGWYDYGVCVDMGWLTDEGEAVNIEEQQK